MAKITSIKGRILYNSRGSKTIEVDIISDNKFLGRVCAPSGASVGKYEAVSFPNEKPEESLQVLNNNPQKFIGLDVSDLKSVHETLKSLDGSSNYSKIGGALAFAVTIASMESASKSLDQPLFQTLSDKIEVRSLQNSNSSFSDINKKERINILTNFEQTEPELFKVLKDFTYESYYTSKEVYELIKYEPHPTGTMGPKMESFDEKLLDRVKTSPPMYTKI